jgi:hypothetical protein
MWSDSIMYSEFSNWSKSHEPAPGDRTAEYEEGLKLLLDGVKTGEISCLDGPDSPVSQKIVGRYGERVFEMNGNWVGSPQDWFCPCCERTKFEIARVGKQNQILAKSMVHHDHMAEVLNEEFTDAFVKSKTALEQVGGKKLIDRLAGAFSAFDAVLVCEDCNNADTNAKKLLNLQKAFTFSINQIRTFIQPQAHIPHKIDAEAARNAWEAAAAAFDLRMRIVRAVAKAAATDSHWFDPHPREFEPVPVFGYENRQSRDISKWFPTEILFDALGRNTRVSKPNVTKWRDVPPKPGKNPPINYLPLLRSDEGDSRMWDSCADDWSCPICHRAKQEIVYVGDGQSVRFRTHTAVQRWEGGKKICLQCWKIVGALKAEVKSELGGTIDLYPHLSHSDIANIIIAKPHTDHKIRKEESKRLVARLMEDIELAEWHESFDDDT